MLAIVYNSLAKIPAVTLPTLFLSGLQDTLIPPKMVKELYNACGSVSKRLVTFSTGNHNNTWDCQGWYDHVGRFMTEVG
ncbi:unnamed protein product, partial [Cyprideis torosa]